MHFLIIIIAILLLLLVVIVLGGQNDQNVAVRSILDILRSHTEEIKVLIEAQQVEPAPLPNPGSNSIPSVILGSILFGFIFMGCFYFDFGSIDLCLESIKTLIESKSNSIINFITENFSVAQKNSKDTASSLLNVLEEMELNRSKDNSEIVKRLNSINLNTPIVSETIQDLNNIDLGGLLEGAD